MCDNTGVEAKASPFAAMRRIGSVIIAPHEWESLFNALLLTQREGEVIICIFDEKSEQAIANELGIKLSTAHTYIQRLYRKLGVNSRMGLSIRVMSLWIDQNGFRKRSSPEQAITNRCP